MILFGDLLNLIDEKSTVFVWTDEDTTEPDAVYDGKESIDSCYNDYEVIKISPCAMDGVDILISGWRKY